MPTRFETDTAVERIAAGRYGARIDEGWWIMRGPNGGYLAAILLRALTTEVGDPDRSPRSLTVHYTRPPVAGDAAIEIVTEREGRSLSTVTARMHQDGRLVAIAIAALATDRDPGSEFSDLTMPDVPAPDAIEPQPLFGPAGVPMRERYEQRWAIGVPPSADRPTAVEGPAEVGGWIRLAAEDGETPVDHHVVTAITDAWPPAVFTKQAQRTPVPTIDLTIHFREPPPARPGWCLVRFRTRHLSGGFLDEDGEIWSEDGRLLAQSRQLGLQLPPA
jgi:acyl-CoA thioesterase